MSESPTQGVVSEPEKRYRMVTSTSVRTEDAKRGIPLDALKFLLGSRDIGRGYFGLESDEEGKLEHTHLVNDLSIAGISAAKEAWDSLPKGSSDDDRIHAVVTRLGTLLNVSKSNVPDEIVERLRPYTNWKIELSNNIAGLSDRRIDVIAASDFVRRDPNISQWVQRCVSMVLESIKRKESVDVSKLREVISGHKSRPEDVGVHHSWILLLTRTLPERIRRLIAKMDEPSAIRETVAQAVYGVFEGCPASGSIALSDDEIYVSYRGSEKAGDDRTIIENMRFLAQAEIFKRGGNDMEKIVQAVQKRFLVERALDGSGFRTSDAEVVHCDPHSLDLVQNGANGSGTPVPPMKLPLLVVDDGKVRAATLDECLSALQVSSKGFGGIDGGPRHSFRTNTPALVRLLGRDCERLTDDDWRKIGVVAPMVSHEVIKEWVRNAYDKAALAKNPESFSITPLAPADSKEVAAALMSIVAEKVNPKTNVVEASEN